MTRTQNSFANALTGIGSSLLIILLNFVTRTVFVRTLGTSYLGIEGLFSNILSLLSLTDLGLGTAIIYKLYKPIEENDRQRILVLLKLYRQAYLLVGAVIVALGLLLIPFLPHLVRNYGRFAELGLNPILIFLIYLLNTASSYWFFAYKASFVQANQKSYLITVTSYALNVLSAILQIVSLAVFRSFLLYLAVSWFSTVLYGILASVICDRRFPYVREKTADHVSREELRDFAKDCGALMIYQVHNVVINSTDNIVLSAVIGLDAVGLYANYLVVKNSLRNILTTVMLAFQASLGSLNSVGNLDWSRLVFRAVNLLTVWLYGVAAIGSAVLLDDFLTLWIGSDFVLSQWTFRGVTFAAPVALAIGVEFYIIGYRQFFAAFRNSMGLFRQMQYRPIASVIVNLVVCIPCVYVLGPLGCVLSTIVAGLTTNMIFDPVIIHRYGLKSAMRPYIARNAVYALVVAVSGFLCWKICSFITAVGVFGFLLRGFVCALLPSALLALCFFRTEEFAFLWNTGRSLLRGGGKPASDQ